MEIVQNGSTGIEMKVYRYLSCAFIIALIFITGCDQGNLSQAESTQATEIYHRDGLTLTYPQHWQFEYDESPDIYVSRAVGFHISEFSTARILLEQSQPLKLKPLVDRLENELQLTSSEFIIDYERQPIQIAGFEGEQLSWTDNFVGTAEFEVTVIDVSDRPISIIAVFNLSDEDIAKESQHIESLLKNITFK